MQLFQFVFTIQTYTSSHEFESVGIRGENFKTYRLFTEYRKVSLDKWLNLVLFEHLRKLVHKSDHF